MKKKLCVVALMASLMFWGCSREGKQAEAPAPESMTAVEQTKEKVAETTEAVKEKAEAVGEAVEEKTKAVGQAVEEKATAVGQAVEEKTAVVVEKSKQTAADIKAAVMEKSGQTAADKPMTTVETVVIDNKNGKVVLSHKKHAEAHGCIACHGTKKPGPFELGKDAAHALCQGCHKKSQAGPTGCTQCHQKKAKAVEGC